MRQPSWLIEPQLIAELKQVRQQIKLLYKQMHTGMPRGDGEELVTPQTQPSFGQVAEANKESQTQALSISHILDRHSKGYSLVDGGNPPGSSERKVATTPLLNSYSLIKDRVAECDQSLKPVPILDNNI